MLHIHGPRPTVHATLLAIRSHPNSPIHPSDPRPCPAHLHPVLSQSPSLSSPSPSPPSFPPIRFPPYLIRWSTVCKPPSGTVEQHERRHRSTGADRYSLQVPWLCLALSPDAWSAAEAKTLGIRYIKKEPLCPVCQRSEHSSPFQPACCITLVRSIVTLLLLPHLRWRLMISPPG